MTAIPPVTDVAQKALDKSQEVLQRLEAMTNPGSAPESASVPVEPSMGDQLDALEPLMDIAVDSGNEEEVQRLIQRGKEIIRAERAAHVKLLEDAQAYFDEALKEYGESGEQTLQASAEVKKLEQTLKNFEIFIAERDDYYDAVLANMHPPTKTEAQQPEPIAEPAPVAEERSVGLAELLATLNSAEAAYQARVDEIRREKKSVAEQLVAERIAQLQASITS